ncbi:MAG: ABC transporter substrate-binding protein [Croceicoccus sp.]|nr:ABC transporter substrate-binding protein [Croceicoccus sp.]|tara:strand:- start:5346 stop:7037 length:1692 start_codon:yes stop_codon:yes gene_type:complete
MNDPRAAATLTSSEPWSPIRRAFAILTLIFSAGLLAACGSGERYSDEAARNGILLWGNGSEPKGLDPHLVTGVPENKIISSLLEGLIAYHPTDDLQPEPGMAERWESNEDFSQWTFHLRDAQWSNGDPVRASDFVYSWERMLTPSLGAEYAEMLYILKGAEDFHQGRTTDFSTVGVKALDDKTLQVTLEGPAPFFLNMLKHYSWYPVNPRVVEAHGGMTDRQSSWSTLENYVGNGPFVLDDWVTNQIIKVRKSPTYWDRDRVKLNGVNFYPVENVTTEETMFRGGRLHLTNTVTPDKIPIFLEKMPQEMKIEPYMGVYFYRINVTRKPFDDVRVRKALAYSIDKKLLVDKVTKGGQIPATGFVPPGLKGYETSDAAEFQPELARRLLAEAGYPGGRGFPDVEILINTSEAHRKIAEALQAMWRKELDVNIGIYNQEWKVYLDSQSNLDYDLVRAGWIADYAYPNTFLDIFTTGNGNNDTGWSNQRYDTLIGRARTAQTDEQRMAILQEAEQVLMEDMPIIPIYWYTRTYLKSTLIEGWHPKALDNHPIKYVSLKAPPPPASAE